MFDTETKSNDKIIPITDEFKERLKSKRVKSVRTAFNIAKKRTGLDKSECQLIKKYQTLACIPKGPPRTCSGTP